MPISDEKLKSLVHSGELSKVDFKKELGLGTEDQKKEFAKDISAIANTSGGTGYLLIGVTNSKQVVGINLSSFREEQMQQIIARRVDLPVVFSVYVKNLKGKPVGVIEIPASLKKPHQIKNEGIFYIRRGTTTDLMSIQEIVNAVKRRLENERQSLSEYEQYPMAKRRNEITNDIIEVFKETGFKYTRKNIDFSYYDNRGTFRAHILTNNTTKQRFCFHVESNSVSKYDMYQILGRIDYWWKSLSESNYLDIGLVFNHSSFPISSLDSSYSSRDNMTVKRINNKNAYYGIGDINTPSRAEIKAWYDIESAFPKFFLMKIKSKDDIRERVSLIQEFIHDHKPIFKMALKLKSYYIMQKKMNQK